MNIHSPEPQTAEQIFAHYKAVKARIAKAKFKHTPKPEPTSIIRRNGNKVQYVYNPPCQKKAFKAIFDRADEANPLQPFSNISQCKQSIQVVKIQHVVESVTGISAALQNAKYTKNGDKKCIEARELTLLLASEYADISKREIGRELDLNHALVLRGIKKAQERIKVSDRAKQQFESCNDILKTIITHKVQKGYAVDGNQKNYATILDVQRVVAEVCLVSVMQQKSISRDQYIVQARQLSMYICNIHLSVSCAEIGRNFGWRDHTTAIHGVDRIRKLIPICPETQSKLDQCLALLKGDAT